MMIAVQFLGQLSRNLDKQVDWCEVLEAKSQVVRAKHLFDLIRCDDFILISDLGHSIRI